MIERKFSTKDEATQESQRIQALLDKDLNEATPAELMELSGFISKGVIVRGGEYQVQGNVKPFSGDAQEEYEYHTEYEFQKSFSANPEKSQSVFNKLITDLYKKTDEENANLVLELQKEENFSVKKRVVEGLQGIAKKGNDEIKEKINKIVGKVDSDGEIVAQQKKDQQLQEKQHIQNMYNHIMTKDVKLSEANISTQTLLKCAQAAGQGVKYDYENKQKDPKPDKVNKFYKEIARRLIKNPQDAEIKNFLDTSDNAFVKKGVDAILKEKYEKLNSDISEYVDGLDAEFKKELSKSRDIGDGRKSPIVLLEGGSKFDDNQLTSMKNAGSIDQAGIDYLKSTKVKLEQSNALKATLSNPNDEVIDYAKKINAYSKKLPEVKNDIAKYRDTAVDKLFKGIDEVLGTHLHSTYEQHFKPPSKGAKLIDSSEKVAEMKHVTPDFKMH